MLGIIGAMDEEVARLRCHKNWGEVELPECLRNQENDC